MQLDNVDMSVADPRAMAAGIHDLPEQLERAAAAAREFPLPLETPRRIVVVGMGGSAIGGDFLRALLLHESPVPITVCRDRHLPASVDRETLVLAVSYSGNTQETLQAYEEARAGQAAVVAYSSGGELAGRAARDHVPHYRMASGLAPRAAIGEVFLPLLVTVERLGLVPPTGGAIAETIQLLRINRDLWGEKTPLHGNPAKQLAETLAGRIPVIYGSNPRTGVAALRWKTQLNENAKVPAAWNVFPELCHNELVGWRRQSGRNDGLAAVLLREREDPPVAQRQIDLARGVIKEGTPIVREIWGVGKSLLARLFYLSYLGDYVSLYLAWLLGEDPGSVEVLEWLKREMADR